LVTDCTCTRHIPFPQYPPGVRWQLSSRSRSRSRENLLECSPELHVEYGVDDRVQEAVHVTEPDQEREEDRIDPTDSDLVKEVVTDTDGVDDVDCEERDPTQQKNTCKQRGHVMQYR